MNNQLSDYFEALHQYADVHGVLGVFANGEAVEQRAFGRADDVCSSLNTVHSRFPIGSLSKSFTAAAVLALEQQGMLKLSDAAVTHLPGVGLDSRITLQQLLLHRSGMVNHTALPGYWPDWMQTFHTPEVLIRKATAMPLLHEPGSSSCYSNSGYAVLAAVVEAVSEKPLHVFLDERFWGPLGLQRMGLLQDADTKGHELSLGRPRSLALDPSVAFGAYGLVGTAQDLASWWVSSLNGKALGLSGSAAMFAGVPSSFGYGWWLDELEVCGKRWRTISHKADVNGHTAMLIGLPESRVCSIVLFNTASTPAAGMARRLLGLALGELWDSYLPALKEYSRWVTGTYRDDGGAVYEVDAARQTVNSVRDYGVRCSYAIRPYAEDRTSQAWRAEAFDERLKFHRCDRSLLVTAPDGSTRRFHWCSVG